MEGTKGWKNCEIRVVKAKQGRFRSSRNGTSKRSIEVGEERKYGRQVEKIINRIKIEKKKHQGREGRRKWWW